MWVIHHVFCPILGGSFDGFSVDSDEVMERLPDGSTDEPVGV